jgi:hypothetical protein
VVQPPNVYLKDDGTMTKPEAILRYTSGGYVPVYEAVRAYGVSTIP